MEQSLLEAGPSALLVDSNFLHDFLKENKLAITWTVIGEKLLIRNNPWPRLVYSRAHILGPRGVKSSKPIITDK